jgi:protein involved in polysaccharide export with SLBB domain
MRNLKAVAAAAVFFCMCAGTVIAQVQAQSENVKLSAPPESPSRGGNGAGAPDLQRRNSRYRLCASDEVAIHFPLTPEFEQSVTIEPDGFVSLSGAGDVHLAGLTIEEATKAIRLAYARVLHDPIVSVELKDFNKPYFVVTGQVNRPGKYDLRGETSATEAVAIAGGMTAAAKSSHVLLFRAADNDRYEVKQIDLKRILEGRDREDAELRPGDMLYVPKNVISKIERFIPSSGFGAYYQLHP